MILNLPLSIESIRARMLTYFSRNSASCKNSLPKSADVWVGANDCLAGQSKNMNSNKLPLYHARGADVYCDTVPSGLTVDPNEQLPMCFVSLGVMTT